MAETKVTKDVDNKTLIIERQFNAPKAKLWRAYADKEWFETWWGPQGWKTTAKEFNFTPGGQIHYGMKCIDPNQTEWYGKESWGLMKIESVDEPNSFSANDYFCSPTGEIAENMPVSKFTVEFVETDGKTTLITRTIVGTAEQLEELIKMGMVEGFSSQLEKLEQLLAK